MKTLLQLAFISVVENLESPLVGPRIQFLLPMMKTKLFEYILLRGKLTENTRPYFDEEFFENLDKLILSDQKGGQLNEEIMNIIANSGCSLKEFSFDERENSDLCTFMFPLVKKQNSLKTLQLRTPSRLHQDLLNLIKSDRLKKVTIQHVVTCGLWFHVGFVHFAVNNPTITHLDLKEIILDKAECDVIFSALSNSLERLMINVNYDCIDDEDLEENSAFSGANTVPFFEMIDAKCQKLRYFLCIRKSMWEWRNDRQLRVKSTTLEVLSLEGHFFRSPILLPANIRKLKLSLDGTESGAFFEALYGEHLPNLERLYIRLNYENDSEFDETWFMALFPYLGSKIVAITDINENEVVFAQLATFICRYCVNLKKLHNIQDGKFNGDGSELLALFQDKDKADKLRHLELGMPNLSHELLSFMADNCVKLKTLDLCGCKTLDDTLLGTLAANCAGKLRFLKVAYCPKITGVSIRSIAVHCAASLEEINVFGTKVSNDGISALATNCLRLRKCSYDRWMINGGVHIRLQRSLGAPDTFR